MKRWIGTALMVLALAGCGGGDGDGPASESPQPLQDPAFDLTGRWLQQDVACTSVSDDLPPGALAEMDGQLAQEALQHPGLRILQTDSDLEITYLDDGERIDGTISGDEVQYFVSEYREEDGWKLDYYSEINGAVLDVDTIDVTQQTELTFTHEERTGTVDIGCTGSLIRVGP